MRSVRTVMNIGIRLHDVEKGSLSHRLEIARNQGFGCAHLALSKVIDNYKMTLPELTPGWACEIRHEFERTGLDIAVLGCYLNLATPDEATLKKNIDTYKAHLRFNKDLGATVVGTETGAPNTAYKFEPACRTPEALEIFINNLKTVVDYAEKLGQIVAVEPVIRHIMWNPAVTRTVLDLIASPNLMVIFDPVNLISTENYERRNEIWAEAVDLLANDIAMVHLKDFVVENGEMKSAQIGQGIVDYTAVLRFLKEKKPGIHVTLEETRPDYAETARKHIQSIYDNIVI